MKRAIAILIVLSILTSHNRLFAQAGDVAFWLPLAEGTLPAEAQVKRNADYISIRLQSVYAYYRPGFLENIKKIVVSSEICASGDRQPVQSTMINKVWQVLDKTGDFIGVNDHLVVLSPATLSNIKISVSFRGIGEDRFQYLFDALTDPTLKTALSLSPATSTTISAVAPTIQKLLTSPYRAQNPRQILDISQSFVIYSDVTQAKSDSLREGYLVIVSSRENRSDDLSKLLALNVRQDVRLSPAGNGLEYRDQGTWRAFKRCSHVVLSVTKTGVRGENEYANWFGKYTEAERTAQEKRIAGQPLDPVKTEAISLWRDGNALLHTDQEYIQSERDVIKATHFKKLTDALAGEKSFAALRLDTKALGVPSNFQELAREYEKAVAQQAGQIGVYVLGESKLPLSHIRLFLTNMNNGAESAREGWTNATGKFALTNIAPGRYMLESEQGGSWQTTAFVLDPKENKQLNFEMSKTRPGPTDQ